MPDAVILPLAVAAERTGVDAETLRGAWGVQELVRRLPDQETEIALRIPIFLLEQFTAWPVAVRLTRPAGDRIGTAVDERVRWRCSSNSSASGAIAASVPSNVRGRTRGSETLNKGVASGSFHAACEEFDSEHHNDDENP